MAVLHSYADSADKTGYYLKDYIPNTGYTTIQTRRICDDLFEWLGFSIGDQVPQDLLNGLLEVNLLYTGNQTAATENIPDDFDFKRDVKNVLTEGQYNRLVGFVKSYGDQAPSQVVNLIDKLDAQTAVVDDSYVPDTSGGSDQYIEGSRREVNHGRFKGIIEEIYEENETSEVVDPLPDLQDEYHSAKAAVSYHRTQQPITAANRDDEWLEYATRAVVDTDDGVTGGPVCGFRVNLGDTRLVVAEVIVDTDDLTACLSHGEQGIRHRVVLGDDTPEWETVLPVGSKYARSSARTTLLAHQVTCLEVLETTLEWHSGISKDGMIEQVIEGGYLEHGTRTAQNVWQDSTLLGKLLSSDSLEGGVTGTVEFFNDTGGYGFIETDAHEEDVFYHMEDIGGPDITEGQELRFNIIEADKGPRATDVERN